MKKNLFPAFGLLTLILAACAVSATPTPLVSEPATEIFIQPTETSIQPVLTDTAIPPTETATGVPTGAPAVEVSFANDIMPIFSNSCTKCHGGEQVKEGLNVTSYSNLMAGSFNGEVIVAGKADESLLIKMLMKGKMPKRGPKLTTEQIQIIVNWINAGALNN